MPLVISSAPNLKAVVVVAELVASSAPLLAMVNLLVPAAEAVNMSCNSV